MDKFTTLTGVAAPLPIRNVDTDMIIPKQFLKTIKRTGLGKSLFYEMRFDQQGNEVADFVLNQPAYRASTRRGRCWTSASAASSRRTSPTFSTTTVSRTAFCRSSCRSRKSTS